MEPLANPVWHALTGPQAKAAERSGDAVRYHGDVAPFAALPDPAPAAAWDDLRELLGPGGTAVLFRAAVRPPAGWDVVGAWPTVQMRRPVADPLAVPSTGPDRRGQPAVVDLRRDDVPDMLDLVAATRPGPFGRRTIALGDYLGIRDGDRLIAMAGERMHLAGHREISAVCTAASHRGRGLAALLVQALAARISARGEEAFLHVVRDNAPAIALYEAMGFVPVRFLEVVAVRWIGA